jgi:hypothetical protein
MKKFILKSTYFFIPIIIYIVVTQFFLYRINEHLPIKCIIEKQQVSKEESYYNRILLENVLDIYKYNTLLTKKPQVLVLGQSIVLCFRNMYFKPFDTSFYNTGLMVRNVQDLENMANQLLNGTLEKPRYILFGLDHSFVLENSILDSKKFKTSLWEDPYFDSKKQLRSMQQVFLKSDIQEVPENNIGFGKRGMVGNGYRKDGSCNNKWEIDLYTNESIHTEGVLIEDLNNQRNGYPNPMNFDQQKASRVLKTLNLLRKNNIEILIYFPPLSDEFFKQAYKREYFKKFWGQYLEYQNQYITYGFNVIPFTTPSQFGLNDYYMLNSDHPGEIFVAKQFLEFYKNTQNKEVISSQFDLLQLEKLINQAKHPLSFQIENQCIL